MTPSPLTADQASSSVGQFRYDTVEAVDAVIAQIEQEIAERRAKIAELEQVRADLGNGAPSTMVINDPWRQR